MSFFFSFFLWGGGGVCKNDYFGGLEIFVDILGVISNFDNLYGLCVKINFCNLCSVMNIL